jgi:hypothetical protein
MKTARSGLGNQGADEADVLTSSREGSMRYQIQYDAKVERWTVTDSQLAQQLMGVHASEEAAQSHAEDLERLCKTYDHYFMGVPPTSTVTLNPVQPEPVRQAEPAPMPERAASRKRTQKFWWLEEQSAPAE